MKAVKRWSLLWSTAAYESNRPLAQAERARAATKNVANRQPRADTVCRFAPSNLWPCSVLHSIQPLAERPIRAMAVSIISWQSASKGAGANRSSRRIAVCKHSYSGSASPVQTGAATCKARPTDHRSVYISTRVGTNMPRYALNLRKLLQPLNPINPPKPTTPATPSAPCCTAPWPNTSRPLAGAGQRGRV